jgi:NAD(P)-dependent dehydrogenase (short-subunit alcohol dehydrogenase family)
MVADDYSLEGKTALVTGAGSGIGKAISLALAEYGASLVCVGRTVEKIEKTALELRKKSCHAIAVSADVTISEQVEAAVKKAISKFGKIDILVNNAGTNIPKPIVPLPDFKIYNWEAVPNYENPLSNAEWHHVLDTNLTGAFYCCRAVGPHMIERRQGKIINITSIQAQKGDVVGLAYCVSKAGLVMLTRSLAVEWARYNINVNAIGPGFIHTALSDRRFTDEKLKKSTLRQIPLGRFGDPRDVGLLAVYMASKAADYMTGQVVYLDGGVLAL